MYQVAIPPSFSLQKSHMSFKTLPLACKWADKLMLTTLVIKIGSKTLKLFRDSRQGWVTRH